MDVPISNKYSRHHNLLLNAKRRQDQNFKKYIRFWPSKSEIKIYNRRVTMACVRYVLKAQMKWLQFSPKPMSFPPNLIAPITIMLYNVIICIYVLFIYYHLGKIRDYLREFRIKTENIYLWFRRLTFLSNFWISLSLRNLIIQLNFLLDTAWAPTNLFSTNSSSILDNSKSIVANLTARSTSRGQVLIFSEIFALLLLTESKNLVKFSVRMGSGFGNPDIILIQLFRLLSKKY